MTLYDHIAAIYDADMAASMDLPDLDCYLRAARAADGPVLELGCGNGRVLAALQDAGIEAVGIDLSLPMLRGARARLGAGAALAQMDLRQLALRAEFALALLPYSLVTHLHDDHDWRRLATGLKAALRPGATVLLDAFIPRPELNNRGWLRDYARRLGASWLVRHKRISRLADGRSRIERRYRCRGAFDGRTLYTSEIIRAYDPVELKRQTERFIGPVQALEYDYGLGPGPGLEANANADADADHDHEPDLTHGAPHRRFCTITARLQSASPHIS